MSDMFELFKLSQSRKDPVVKADLTGKVIIVTGANTGIGYEIVKHFAGMNPKKLILACRSESRGQAALDRLTKEAGFHAAELWLIDQNSFASVQAFATKADQELDRLDILVQNAGFGTAQGVHSVTQDGWEEGLQGNNLSPELLALLLLPKLFKTKEQHNTTPRIVIVSSSMHEGSSIAKDVVESDQLHKQLSSKSYLDTKPANEKTYILYKLLNVFFARALHKHLPPSSIIVNIANPGYCQSELLRSLNKEERAGLAHLDAFAYTSEEGARHVIWAALAHEGEQTLAGAYASVSQVQPVGQFVTGDSGVVAEKKLWEEAIQILGKVDERVPMITTKYLV